MTYETAKKLKDAGFDKEHKFIWGFYRQNPDMNELLPRPTLEELIEACGKRFDSLVRYGDQWVARTEPNGKWGKIEFIGPTPIVAVANLWIELNKK